MSARFPTLAAVAQWLGQGAVHPPPFNLDAAEAVIEEARMVIDCAKEIGCRWTIERAEPGRRVRILFSSP